MAHLTLRLFGPFQVTLDGEVVTDFRSDKVRALLAYLAVETERPHRREKLAGLLWPDWPERSARANLRRALANLRQVIGDHQATPHFLHISRQTIQLNSASDAWVDVTAFTDYLETKLPSQRIARQLEEAVALYRGSFLEGFSIGDSAAFEEWSLLNRERFHRLVIEALQRLAECHEEDGEYERALQYTWRQVGLDPWREIAHQQLMRLLALSGQRGAALAQYETCRRLLAEELGIEPAAETTRLYEQIRNGGEVKVPEAPPTRLPDIPSQPPSFLHEEVPVGVEKPVFVGRERELKRMNELLRTALAGKGRVIFVTGDAGRGKTTLLDEFARRALDTYPDLLVATGNCNAYSGIGDPYLPFRDVIAMLTGDVEARWSAGAITRDHACRLWEVLPSAVQMLVDRGPELVGIFLSGRELATRAEAAAPGRTDCLERLKELVERGQAGHGDLEQSHLFEQYTNVLRGLAVQRPLLIVLDDLQWADPASISLLFHLGRRIDGHRILIAGAYRPDEVALGRDGERHPLEAVLTEFKRHFGDAWVDLEKAKEAEARRFVDALLDTEPNRLAEDFRQALFRRTGGHPLFTIELMRAMQERGDLVRDEQGRWVEGPVLGWETLPARVEGVIEERIGRLKTELRELLSVASVEGEEFTAQVVARVQQVDERWLLRGLSQELEKCHHLVRERAEVQVGHRPLSRYQFVHTLFQQYLYGSLGAGERRLLHREVALVLEELYEERTEEIAVQLARHYAGAGDAERERHYAQLAGERAAARFANEEALHYLNRALDLTPEGDTAERYALLLAREKVFDLQGERQAQKLDLAALESLAGDLNDDRRRVEVALRQAHYAETIGDYPTTIAAAQAAIDLARAVQDMKSEAAGYQQWGWALWHQGKYKAARLQLGQALNLARVAGLHQVEADSLHFLGIASGYQGDHAEAWTYLEQALRIEREMGDRRGESSTLNTLGITSRFEGDYARGRACFEQALCISREIGDRRSEGMLLDSLGLLLHQSGDDEAAWECSRQALVITQEVGDRRMEGYAWTTLGHALAGLERLAEASDAYQQALALRRELGQHNLAMESLAGLARVSLAQGNMAQAQVEEILSHLETKTLDGTEEPFRVYLTCYRVLRVNQDPRAEAILNTAHHLLQEQAAKISDEELRRSFLENVPAHREIVSEVAKGE